MTEEIHTDLDELMARCINPEHLSIGTVHDNNWDMIRKGRYGKTGGCKPKYFTREQWLEMKKLEGEGWSQRKIAAKFNSQQGVIQRYLSGDRYV